MAKTVSWTDLASAARTASANGAGSNVEDFGTFTMLVDATVATSGTLDVKVQVSDNNSDWFDLAVPEDSAPETVAVAQIATTPTKLAITFQAAAIYMRCSAVGASTPIHTYSVRFIALRGSP